MAAVETTQDDAPIRRFVRGWWLLLPFQLLLVVITGLHGSSEGWLLQGMQLLTAAMCAFGLSRDLRPFSLNQVFWVFTFVFMALMPALFYNLNFLPHGRVPEHLLLKASGLILVCTLLYSLVSLFLSSNFSKTEEYRNADKPFAAPAFFKTYAPWIMGLCVLAMATIIGPANIWLPTDFWAALSQRVPNTFLQLLIQYGLRGAMLALCLIAAYSYRQGQLSGRFFLLLLILALIGNFPLVLSRYLAGAFYLSILLWVLPFRYLKAPGFALTLLALILLAAPLLNAPRMQHFPVGPGEKRDLSFLLRTSYSGDYDAFALLCRSIQYTDSFGDTGGRQLAGAALFFVPRSQWPDKPVGSGSMVFDKTAPRADQWNNVSCPLIGEGYVNFGFAGSLLFMLLLAVTIFFYDRKFWHWQRSGQHKLSYPVLFYPVAVGLLLLWLRGDMLSSMAYTTGLLLSGWVVHLLFFRRKQR